jgi:hypothetical protein
MPLLMTQVRTMALGNISASVSIAYFAGRTSSSKLNV